MTMPKTLMQMVGAPSTPPPLDASAVVMIDCQREYADGGLPLPGIAAALDEGARLLALARQRGAPVIHVRHRGMPGGLFDPESALFEICDVTAPAVGEAIVDKSKPNAFAETDLAERVRATGRDTLVIAGFMTHMCVSSTVRAALDQGFGCSVVGGACTTRDLPDGAGGVIRAADLHRAELAALADRFAIIVDDASALTG